MPDNIPERVCRVVADVFGIPLTQVALATTHENVKDWDSLSVINLLMAIESEFDVSMEPEDAAHFGSVQGIVDILKTRLA
jgi:acyl carrier protein